MTKSIITFILASSIFSTSTLADSQLELKVTPNNGGAWVQVEKNGVREAGIDIIVNNNHEEHYQTSESGRVYIPSHYNSSQQSPLPLLMSLGIMHRQKGLSQFISKINGSHSIMYPPLRGGTCLSSICSFTRGTVIITHFFITHM